MQSERQKRDFISLPHGKSQVKRDEGLRDTWAKSALDWEEADEDFLRGTYEEYIDQFAYDPREVSYTSVVYRRSTDTEAARR